MSKLWDDKMKRIFAAAPQDYVSWLLPGARFIGKASLELKTLTRTVSTDALYKAVLDDELVILHVEFQKRTDPDMEKRIWEYNVLATLEHNCPVYSFVIYLMRDGKIEEPPLEWGLAKFKKVHVFQYTNIKLWELTVETLLEEHLTGLLPLCLLTQNGMRHEVAEDIFESLVDKKELLTLALTFASMIFEGETDQQWLKRRIGMLDDIIRETWFYKDLFKEAKELAKEEIYKEAKEEGKEEGKEESLQEFRLAVLDVIQERFPEIVEFAKKQIEPIKESVVLRQLIVQMSAAPTIERARQYIEELGKEKA